MSQTDSLAATAFWAWEKMSRSAVLAAFLFGFVSLPVMLATVVLAREAFGLIFVVLAVQVMMTTSFELHMSDKEGEIVDNLSDEIEQIEVQTLLFGALAIGGAAQAVLIEIPVVVGVYIGPAAGFAIALLFPFADGKLNQIYKWLSPSAIARYAAYKLLEAVSLLPGLEFDAIEATFPGIGKRGHH